MWYYKTKQGCCTALLVLFAIMANKTIAQTNLVPNPSFEQYSNCPNRNLSTHTISPDVWYKPDKGGGGL